MQCNCREEVEAKVRKHVEAKLPEGFTDYDAKIQGFGFALAGNKLEAPFFIQYQGDVMVPKKGGNGMKRQKIDTTLIASYCPFCGMAAEPEDESKEVAE